jgi:hypothetical protein
MPVASLVLGIIGIVFAIIPGINFMGLILGVVGIILGALGMKQLKEAGEPTGVAMGGLVCSIIASALGLILYLACVAFVTSAARSFGSALRNFK